MKIAVIIVNWNKTRETLKCIRSLFHSNKKNFNLDVIVVDNNSHDKNIEKIEKLYSTIKLISNKKNGGFSEGNNLGIKYVLNNLKTDFIFLLNNDAYVDKNCLNEMLKTFKRCNAEIISPKIYFSPGHEFHKNRYQKKDLGKVIWYAGGGVDWANVIGYHIGVDIVDNELFNNEVEVDYATGAAMMMKIHTVKKIGLLDEKYYLYFEDLDYSIRTKKLGYHIYFSPNALVWHDNAGSSSSGSSLQDYYLSRNRMLFGLRYAPFNTKLNLIRESIGLLKIGRYWQKKGIIDFYKRNFGKGSYE